VNHPNERQVGGDHYKKAGHQQHWDSLPACGFGWEYYIGRATAYLTRVKNPLEDPGKAGHFVDKLMVLINEGRVPPEFQTTQGFRLNSDVRGRLVDVESYLRGYFQANDIWPDSPEAKAITLLMMARTRDDLVAARTVITEIEATRQREVPGGDRTVAMSPLHGKPYEFPEAVSQTATASTGDADPGYTNQAAEAPFASGGGGGGATGSWDGEGDAADQTCRNDSPADGPASVDDAAPSSSNPD
jgi:hypothetical protein